MAVLKLCHISFCQERLVNQSELVFMENMLLIIYEPVLGGFQQKSDEVLVSIRYKEKLVLTLKYPFCYFQFLLQGSVYCLAR